MEKNLNTDIIYLFFYSKGLRGWESTYPLDCMLINICVNAFEIRMWTGWKSILLSDDCLWKVFSGSGTRSVNHIFRELIKWALPKHEWGYAISHPSEEHSRAWVFPSFILTVFCLAFASSQAEAFVCPWEVGVRYETYKESWLKLTHGAPSHSQDELFTWAD